MDTPLIILLTALAAVSLLYMVLRIKYRRALAQLRTAPKTIKGFRYQLLYWRSIDAPRTVQERASCEGYLAEKPVASTMWDGNFAVKTISSKGVIGERTFRGIKLYSIYIGDEPVDVPADETGD